MNLSFIGLIQLYTSGPDLPLTALLLSVRC